MKTTILKNGIIYMIVLFIIGLASCSEDEVGPSDETDTTDVDTTDQFVAKYVMSLRTQNADDESADYFLALDDIMSGEISAQGQGIELVGWNYNGFFGDRYFAFGYDLNECVGYDVIDGALVEQGKFVFERFDVMNAIDDDYFMAIGAPWGGGSYNCQLQVVDINDISISKNVQHPIYESYYYVDSLDMDIQLNAWPTGSYVDGDKLYVAFYPLEGASWITPNTDTAFVSVFSYPEIEYIKTIKDSRTSPIGYYGGSPSIIEDESGNHYTLSGSALSTGFSQATKPSGILRINAGEEEFDPEYFFNVEAEGYKVISGAYAGNGLVVARVITPQMDEAAADVNSWAAFSEVAPILNVAVLDLNNQTISVVNEIPLHGGQYQTPYLVENGKVYVSVNDSQEAFVYEVDAATATATKGAKLIGNQFQALFAVN